MSEKLLNHVPSVILWPKLFITIRNSFFQSVFRILFTGSNPEIQTYGIKNKVVHISKRYEIVDVANEISWQVSYGESLLFGELRSDFYIFLKRVRLYLSSENVKLLFLIDWTISINVKKVE